VAEARLKVAELRKQDDPTWAEAEYLIGKMRHPSDDAVPTYTKESL
jgi:hypothetical protein